MNENHENNRAVPTDNTIPDCFPFIYFIEKKRPEKIPR